MRQISPPKMQDFSPGAVARRWKAGGSDVATPGASALVGACRLGYGACGSRVRGGVAAPATLTPLDLRPSQKSHIPIRRLL